MESSTRDRQTRKLKRRRVIERPRLFALLDESPNRIRTLVAPAGYGKTTLAEQWVARDGRRGAWFKARSASTDVAALALGMARAAAELVPGCDERLRTHLRAVPNPGERVDVLAEILGEELAGWSPADWLVLDEYQELVGAEDAEAFVEELTAACPIRLLIASRQRPTWVTGRRILYGNVLELNQTVLAMDTREAAELLDGRSAASASGLVALANGWPAVIALASVTDAEIDGDAEVPDSLYRFFAEEVFEALGEDVRAGLATLAIAPVLDRELAAALLDNAEQVCEAALQVGILEERDGRLELHPLARSFLVERVKQVNPSGLEAAMTCYRQYTSRRDWDAAFEVAAKPGAPNEIRKLLANALDDLLDTARLTTIDTWCEVAERSGSAGPSTALARAEVALRYGRHAEAQAFAEVVALGRDSDTQFRALALAGRAAHIASRDAEALKLYERANAVASSNSQRREAAWGVLMCEVELERPEVEAKLVALSSEVRVTDVGTRVRAAAQTLLWQMRMGCLDLDDADAVAELLTAVHDPLIQSSFQSAYSSALALSARYDEALAVALDLESCARRYRLDFALPYASISAAMAHAGLRRFDDASKALGEASRLARGGRDSYAEQLAYAVEVRALAAQGKQESALSLLIPDLRSALPAIRGEVLGSRALVLASVGRVREAETLLSKIATTSAGVELGVLCPAVEATTALRTNDPDLILLVNALDQTAFHRGALDLLVATYRTTPELLSILTKVSSYSERFVDLVRRVGDSDLARVVGQPIDVADDPVERLTRRERDVYDLVVSDGLRYRQVAQALFISEATVKVHMQHIFDKFGVRSRVALAAHAALRRPNQATATRGSTAGTSS